MDGRGKKKLHGYDESKWRDVRGECDGRKNEWVGKENKKKDLGEGCCKKMELSRDDVRGKRGQYLWAEEGGEREEKEDGGNGGM